MSQRIILDALLSYINAIDEYVKCSKLDAAQHILRGIKDEILPTLHKKDFETKDSCTHLTIAEKIDGLIKSLSEIECKNLLDFDIQNLKDAFEEAKIRDAA